MQGWTQFLPEKGLPRDHRMYNLNQASRDTVRKIEAADW